MSGHTKGPWHVALNIGGPKTLVRAGSISTGRKIASTFFNGGDNIAENEANAQLIAAAPSLYEALYDLVAGPMPTSDQDVERIYGKARAAIAKATGEA